jgi:hypothetical protein
MGINAYSADSAGLGHFKNKFIFIIIIQIGNMETPNLPSYSALFKNIRILGKVLPEQV